MHSYNIAQIYRDAMTSYGAARPPFSPEQLLEVLRFHREWQGFRSLEACAEQTGIPIGLCEHIKAYLYNKRLLGLYYFAPNTPPQTFMRRHIQDRFPALTTTSHILEVGPGEYPLFPPEEYPNWIGCDAFFKDNAIVFRNKHWAQDRYPVGTMYTATWETVATRLSHKRGSFDYVVGSHSYEHAYKPVSALKNAAAMLRPGGVLALFVPDGLTDDPSSKDPTHTIYIVPGMLEEFFELAGCFRDLHIEPFRPNADLFVSALRM